MRNHPVLRAKSRCFWLYLCWLKAVGDRGMVCLQISVDHGWVAPFFLPQFLCIDHILICFFVIADGKTWPSSGPGQWETNGREEQWMCVELYTFMLWPGRDQWWCWVIPRAVGEAGAVHHCHEWAVPLSWALVLLQQPSPPALFWVLPGALPLHVFWSWCPRKGS